MIIYNESELKEWFEKNYKKLGYNKILRKEVGKFPDFIMLKNNKQIRVELETKASNFLIHGHSLKDIDEIVCIKKDANLNTKIITIKGLTFIPKERITITIEDQLLTWVDKKIKEKIFANRSHGFEFLIKKAEKEEKEK